MQITIAYVAFLILACVVGTISGIYLRKYVIRKQKEAGYKSVTFLPHFLEKLLFNLVLVGYIVGNFMYYNPTHSWLVLIAPGLIVAPVFALIFGGLQYRSQKKKELKGGKK